MSQDRSLSTLKFQQTSVDELPEKIEEARMAGKHVFLWDMTGQLPLILDGIHFDFTDDMIQVALSEQSSVNETLERGLKRVQAHMFEAMQTGCNFMLNLGMLAPDFNKVYTDADFFPASKVFDCQR